MEEVPVKRKMRNTFFRKNVSIIKDTAKRLNRNIILSAFQKKFRPAPAIESDNDLKSNTLNIILLIFGNLLVILIFIFLYFIL